MDLETLKMIVALAEEKSIVRAAERLNVSVKAVEGFCDDFKRETKTNFLDKAFINRFVSGQGMEVYEKAKKVLHDLETCGKWISDLKPEPAGNITIVTMPFTGLEWLMPRLESFLEKYQKVNIRLILKSPPIQPGEGDVVITVPTIGPRGRFIGWAVTFSSYSLYASPKYLKKKGTPNALEDLDNHHLISFRSGYSTNYGYYNESLTAGLKNGQLPRKPYFEVDSLAGMMTAAKLGFGIAELPNLDFITNCESLVNILPDFRSPVSEFHYIFERHREKSILIKELHRHIKDAHINIPYY